MVTLRSLTNGNLVVACHDAGSANLIIYWLKRYKGIFFPCMEGPAKKIWAKSFPNKKNYKLEDVIGQGGTLLSGTGRGNYEHQARIKAKALGSKNIAVIDNWTSFKERFIKFDEELLPDLILVSDVYAKNMAIKFFPGIQIEEFENCYLKEQLKLINLTRKTKPRVPASNILMVMGPTKDNIEFSAIHYFMSKIKMLGLSFNMIKIRLRVHPSEHVEKYNSIVNKYSGIEFDAITDNELFVDIAWADLVVGMFNYPMVVALNSKIPTMSIMPPNSQKCPLPHSEIIHLREL